MFEKIGRAAENVAARVSMSRRGFLSRYASLAAGAALGIGVFLTPAKAWSANFKCKCCNTPFGCNPSDAACIERCAIYCCSLKKCGC
jgi:hypothetical protein